MAQTVWNAAHDKPPEADIDDYDVVVVAAGVWSKPLVAGLGYPVPLVAQRGYHVTFTNPGVALGRVVLPLAHAATIVPMAMGIRIGGTVEFAGDGAPPNSKRAAALSRHAKATIPALNVGEHTTWMGERPCTPDSLPVLCRAPRHPAVLFAFGHGHQGIIGAPKTAEVIADLVAERPPRLDIAPFDVGRFRSLGDCAVEKLTTVYSCIRSFLTATYGVRRCPKAFCDASS